MNNSISVQSKNPCAIILAAGQGKRLMPFTAHTPKCLLPIGGVPILHRQVEALVSHGIPEIAVVTGYMAESVEQRAREWFPSVNFVFVRNLRPDTNTLYSLALAAEHLIDRHDVFQLNGDVVFDPEIVAVLSALPQGESYVCLQKKPCGAEEIKVVLDDRGAIQDLNKTILPEQAIGEAIGINRFSGNFWQVLAQNLQLLRDSHPGEYFEYAVEYTAHAGGGKIMPCDVSGYLGVEVDTADDLSAAERLFAQE